MHKIPFALISSHSQLVGPTSCGSHIAASGRKYTPGMLPPQNCELDWLPKMSNFTVLYFLWSLVDSLVLHKLPYKPFSCEINQIKKMATTRFCHFLPFKLTYKRVHLEVQCRFLCRLHPLPHRKVLVTCWPGKQIECTNEILLPITNCTNVLFYKVSKLLTLQQNQ